MKKWMLFGSLLISVFLCACGKSSDVSPEKLAGIVSTVTPPPTEIPEPTPTPLLQHQPFSGDFSGYVYYYEDERNKDWEEDIAYITKIFLRKHPKLADVYYPNIKELKVSEEVKDTVSAYKADIKQPFIEHMSNLIFKVEELKDDEIIYELQRGIAMLEDGHSYVLLGIGSFFPLFFEAIKEGDAMKYYVVGIPKEEKQLVFSYLDSINDVPVEEIIHRLSDYISADSEAWTINKIFNNMDYGWIIRTNALQAIGVLGENDNAAEFCFVTEDGAKQRVVLEAVTEDLPWNEMEIKALEAIPTLKYKNWSKNYWYEYMEEDILYLRFLECFEEKDSPTEEYVADLLAEIEQLPEHARIVMDFRENTGGRTDFLDWERLINGLNKREDLNTYILIDEGAYSSGVILPYVLRHRVNNSVLAGTLAGQNPNVCASSKEYTLPNSKYRVLISSNYLKLSPNYEYKSLQPEITIYQTLEDYKQGIDTVLETIKRMK